MTIAVSEPVPNEAVRSSSQSPFARFLQIVGWDGALPLFTALGPLLVKTMLPKPPLGVGLGLFLAPPVAALIRAHIGWHQIAKRCGGRAPVVRQVAMAIAIMLLFVFEAVVSILTFEKNAAREAWCIPVGFYAGYLLLIALALRSAPDSSRLPCGASVPIEQ